MNMIRRITYYQLHVPCDLLHEYKYWDLYSELHPAIGRKTENITASSVFGITVEYEFNSLFVHFAE